jgi:hypothetical protein
MVGREHQQHVRIVVCDHLPVAVDRIRIALIPAALGVTEVGMKNPQAAPRPIEVPGSPAGELPRQLMRFVLLDYPDVGNATVEAVRQREVDQPVNACEREGRLRALVRERGEPPAFAAREHERENTRSLHLRAPSVMASLAVPRAPDIQPGCWQRRRRE